ncbi:MAG TPA: ATP-binding protein [Vicinamibacterales bacterium]|nr:ATP-binding protein [Vicinamibacterales bacterium]
MSGEVSAERLRLLASVASDLLAAERPDRMLRDLCDRAREHLSLDVLLYHHLEGAGERRFLHLHAFSGVDPQAAAAIGPLDLGQGTCGEAAARGAPVVADAANAAPVTDSVAREMRLTALACHPLLGPEGVTGTLSFGSRTRDRFSTDELALMEALSTLAALGLGRVRAAHALHESESRLELANRAAGQGLWEIDLHTSVVILSEKARELFGVAPGARLSLRTDWRPFILAEDRAALMAAIDGARAGDDYQSEFRIRRSSDGRTRWILARGRVLPRTSRLVGVLADVTEAREAAEGQRRALVESERRLQALREKEELLHVAVMAGRGGMFTFDPDGDALELSPEAAVLHGFPEGTAGVSKADVFERVDQPDREKLERSIRDAAAATGVLHSDYKVRLPAGGVRTLTAFCQHQPGRRRVVGFVIDVSERCAVEDALRREDRRKSEFIAILSHELRNPMAPVMYALPVIERAPLGGEARHALEVVKRQMTHLGRLVDDMLDISRINSGKVELRRDVIALQTIVRGVVETTTPQIAAARHHLEVTLPDEPVWLEADPYRLAQVLTNLLSNAAKYTPRGGRIALGASQEGDRAIIRVRDNGVGIAPELMPQVFEMFRQIRQPHGLQGGLGVGLALARTLIEMHGGTIEAHSEGVGKGSEFVVVLPVASRREASPERSGPGPEAAGTVSLKVLIVDDNTDLVEMLAGLVNALGHRARKALDGPSALETARSYRPHVVLLDLGLPIMSGIEVARELRSRPETRGAHLVALTGWGQEEDRERTREAGFDEHLTKPTDPETLTRLLQAIAARESSR